MKKSNNPEFRFPDCTAFKIDSLVSSDSLKSINESTCSEFILLIISESEIELGRYAYERISSLAHSFKAGIIYSDYFDNGNEVLTPHSLTDYQYGSVRDNFNFGHIMFFRKINPEVSSWFWNCFFKPFNS